jgi:hypothetical protein
MRAAWIATRKTRTAPIRTPFAFASHARSAIETKK